MLEEQIPRVTLPEILKSVEGLLNRREFCKTGPFLHMIKDALDTSTAQIASFKIDDDIVRMILQYKDDEQALLIITQIVYEVLLSSKHNNRPLSVIWGTVSWHEQLITILLQNNFSSQFVANVVLCLHLLQQLFNDDSILELLWVSLIKNAVKKNKVSKFVQYVIVHFFDEIISKLDDSIRWKEFLDIIEKLVTSDKPDERKTAYELMKKFTKIETSNTMLAERRYWISLVAVLENLEENQSHLILPSLNILKNNEFQKPFWRRWLEIVYTYILTHQNKLVIRWALEDGLNVLISKQISKQMFLNILNAANNSSFYSFEGYFLQTDSIRKLIQSVPSASYFLSFMVEINWKSVPLHFWLNQVSIASFLPQNEVYPNALLFKLAARIRDLTNPYIRQKIIELFENMFSTAIERMDLKTHITLVEALYNISDPFTGLTTLKKKFINNVPITQRFYKIVSNNLENYCNITSFCKTIYKNLQSESQHHCNLLCLMIVFECQDPVFVEQFCQSHFNLSLHTNDIENFEKLRYKWISSLALYETERTFVSEKVVDLFVQLCLNTFTDIIQYETTPEALLSEGSHKTLLKLSTLIAKHASAVEETVSDAFFESLQKYRKRPLLCYNVIINLVEYYMNAYPKHEAEKHADRLIMMDFIDICICEAFIKSGLYCPKDIYLRLLKDHAKTGDARIEEIYEYKLRRGCPKHFVLRKYILQQNYPKDILTSLLDLNNSSSVRKPRYFENSAEHRMKMRIALSLLLHIESANETWFLPAMEAILRHNNQLNICYFYELLAAKCAPNTEMLLDKLQDLPSYTVSQQVSLMSVMYCHCILNWMQISDELLQQVINKLLPLTMGANFQTRLYAQLIIYNIIIENERRTEKHRISGDIMLKNIIGATIGNRLDELLHEVRLLLPQIFLESPKHFYDVIMYITNAPIDEYLMQFDYKRYEMSKGLFTKKLSGLMKGTTNDDIPDSGEVEVNNIQRKMNPIENIFAESTLQQTKNLTKSEMFVVASLVENVPNLGGIARTCDVLGIQNLVLSSKLHAEKREFQSLSMTAEKSLRISETHPRALIEFLKQKQIEGYQIIGAEQTVDSENIIGFEFPRKCVLVLGHEKEGIPSHILGLLDNTIQIPQFGMVRSLNVHVTGALFMWEYCKQHIVDQ